MFLSDDILTQDCQDSIVVYYCYPQQHQHQCLNTSLPKLTSPLKDDTSIDDFWITRISSCISSACVPLKALLDSKSSGRLQQEVTYQQQQQYQRAACSPGRRVKKYVIIEKF